MTAYSREDRVKLCQRITFLPGLRLKEILDLLRRLNPVALKYVDSQWVFDTKHMDDKVLRAIEMVVDNCQRTMSAALGKSSSQDSIQIAPMASSSSVSVEREGRGSRLGSSSKKRVRPEEQNELDSEMKMFEISGVPITVKKRGRMCCGICKKEFRVRSEMVVHVRTHTGEKPLACSVCGKTFAHPSNLKAHERSHRGEKPYKCTYPGCGKSFAHSATLRDHANKHTGKKPHVCSICSKGFTTKAYLKKHERNHALSVKKKQEKK